MRTSLGVLLSSSLSEFSRKLALSSKPVSSQAKRGEGRGVEGGGVGDGAAA